MAPFGGKALVDAVSGIGGNGVGRLLAAVAAAMLVRLFSGPGIALLPENDTDDDFSETEGAGEEDGDSSPGKVRPVTIRWRNITCSLSDKSSKSVRTFSFPWMLLLSCDLHEFRNCLPFSRI